jgi:hypothetical protein
VTKQAVLRTNGQTKCEDVNMADDATRETRRVLSEVTVIGEWTAKRCRDRCLQTLDT